MNLDDVKEMKRTYCQLLAFEKKLLKEWKEKYSYYDMHDSWFGLKIQKKIEFKIRNLEKQIEKNQEIINQATKHLMEDR